MFFLNKGNFGMIRVLTTPRRVILRCLGIPGSGTSQGLGLGLFLKGLWDFDASHNLKNRDAKLKSL